MNIKKQMENALKNNQKNEAVKIFKKALDEGISIIYLYEDVLRDILNSIECEENDQACIWLEHQMTSITRTLLELSYPYILKQKESLSDDKKVIIACPPKETHELGAVMGANMLTLCGFDTTYIGADTPNEVLFSAIEVLTPDYVVLSVTNFYHLFEVDQAIQMIKKDFPDVKILGGGRAFIKNYDHFKFLVDGVITDYASIKTFKKRENL